jgi:hypothetical protein
MRVIAGRQAILSVSVLEAGKAADTVSGETPPLPDILK